MFHTWNMSYFEADSFKGAHCFDLTNAHLDKMMTGYTTIIL